MPPVQEKGGSAISGTTTVITLDAAPTNGNLLILACAHNDTADPITGIAQTGVTWSKVVEAHVNRASAIWKGVVGSSAAAALTVTTESADNRAFDVTEWTGYTSTVEGTPAGNNGVGATPTTASVVTVNPTCLVVACICSPNNATVPTNSFTALTPQTSRANAHLAIAYREVTAAGTYSTGWTSGAAAWSDVIAAFAAPVTATPPSPPMVSTAAAQRAASW